MRSCTSNRGRHRTRNDTEPPDELIAPALPAKDRQLVPEHEDLEFLRSVASSDEHDQLQQAAEDDVHG
jgi:hypothetical protein